MRVSEDIQRRSSDGFTLVEVLVSLAIIVVIGGVITAAMAGAVKVWETADGFGRLHMGTAIGIERMQTDLRNAVPFHAVPFTGHKVSIVFCGVAESEGAGRTFEEIEYRLDAGTRSLKRIARPWPHGMASSYKSETVFENVRSVEFSYASKLDDNPEALVWTSAWTSEDAWFPAGVKIDLQLEDEADSLQLSRTIQIPANPRVYPTEKETDAKTGTS